MPPRFSVRSVYQTETPTGFIFTITTDVPCHLWMRITTLEPWKHRKPVIQRGLAVRDDFFFCFVVYHDNDQEEAGDTLIHTFIKEPWAVCETRWFYFHGTVQGVPSPSTSAIFKKHRLAATAHLLYRETWGTGPLYIANKTLKFYEGFPTTSVPPDYDYLFWEPWGATLLDNNHWYVFGDTLDPVITFDSGIIKLDWTGTPHSGINAFPPPGAWSLLSPTLLPLTLSVSNPEFHSLNPTDSMVIGVFLSKGSDFVTLYFVINDSLAALASVALGYWKLGNTYYAWRHIGTDEHTANLVEYFQDVARHFNFNTDPTGWSLTNFEIAHRDVLPLFNSYLKNDYIGFYYPG